MNLRGSSLPTDITTNMTRKRPPGKSEQSSPLKRKTTKGLVSNTSTSSSAVSQAEKEKEFFMSKPRTGVEGRRFENLIIGNILLTLINEEEFALSAEDEKYDGFDDVVFQVKSGDETDCYAIQLKYGENEGNWHWKKDIKQYFTKYKKLKEMHKDDKMILFTNRHYTGIADKTSLDENNIEIIEIHEHEKIHELLRFLDLSPESKFYKFQLTKNNNDYKDLFFCIDTQNNNNSTERKIKTYFYANYPFLKQDRKNYGIRNYLSFIEKWQADSGKKRKLTKEFMQQVLGLCFLLSDIKYLSFLKTESLSIKQKKFKEAVLILDEVFLCKEHYDTVKYLWAHVNFSLSDIRILKKYELLSRKSVLVRNEYELENIEELGQNATTLIQELNDEEKTLSLWLTDKCPLILLDNEVTQEGRKFWKNKKYILLQETDEIKKNTSLKGLKNKSPELYETTLKHFTCTLQDKEDISLVTLIQQNDKIAEIITMNVLAKLLKNLLIGNEKQTLLKELEKPLISRIIIEDKFLKKMGEDMVIVISNVQNDTRIQYLSTKIGAKVKTLEESLEEDNLEKSALILVTEGSCDEEKFENICTRIPQKNGHHLKMNEGDLEWIRSKNEVNRLRKYIAKPDIVNYYSPDSYGNDSNNINIVYAEPRSGKTTFLKYLINTTLRSYYWGLLVNVDEHFKFFSSDEETTAKQFNDYILEKEGQHLKHFDRKLLEILIEEGRIVYCWDALSERNLETIKKIIKEISENKKTEQWITCTPDLKKDLEDCFNVIAKPIKPFNK